MMSSDDNEKFRKILSAVRDRIEMCRFNHRHFAETKSRLELALEGKSNIVFLVGTTGVGKGVLADTMVEELNEPVKNSPFEVRAICSKSSSPHGNVFSWSETYLDALVAAIDPLPEEKVDRDERLQRLRRGESVSGKRGTPNALRRALIAAIEDRGIEVVFIDEAENFVIKEGGYGFGNRLRVIRDLSMVASGDPIAGQKRGCKIVLLSTPGVLEEVMESSSEILRRTNVVEFCRYDLKGGVGGEGNEGFRGVVHSLLECFPSEYRPRFSTDKVLSLQMDSMGVIGNLIDWFVEAINLCLSEGARSLEWLHFERTALSDYKLEMLSKQCKKDDKILRKVTKRNGCGLARQAALKEERRKEKESEAVSVETTAKRSSKPKGTRVGEQKPGRHQKTGS